MQRGLFRYDVTACETKVFAFSLFTIYYLFGFEALKCLARESYMSLMQTTNVGIGDSW